MTNEEKFKSLNTKLSYLPIPVSYASVAGERFGKDLIVILAWDVESQTLHTTTWGRFPAAKDWAANLGEICAKASGADVAKSHWYEDYRATKEAEYKAKVDALSALVDRYRNALENISDIPDEFTIGADAANEAVRLATEALVAEIKGNHETT